MRCLIVGLVVAALGIMTAQGLPEGWTAEDVGAPGVAGSGEVDSVTGVWSVSGGGSDIWGGSDQFHYTHTSATGNCTLVAHVDSVELTDWSAKAGLMMRTSSEADAPFVYMLVTQNGGVALQWRSSTAADAESGTVSYGFAAPVWIKLVRTGNKFTGYYSENGANWLEAGSTILSLPSELYAGLAVTAHDDDALNTSTFGSVAVLESDDLEEPAQRVNLAKYQEVSATSENSPNVASFLTDGFVGTGNRWQGGSGAQSAIISFPSAVSIGSAHLYLGTGDQDTVADFTLDYWDGSAWQTIPGASFSGNTSTVLNVIFSSDVETTMVRFNSSSDQPDVREIALFPPNGGEGYPIGTDVYLSATTKRPAAVSSFDGCHYAKGAVDGYTGEQLGYWQTADADGPHTLEVDLLEATRIGSAQIYTGSELADAVDAFSLQYWTGSAWSDIPGGTVSDNTNKALTVSFSEVVSASRIRMLISGSGAQIVRELAVYPASTGITEFPSGAGLRAANPPLTEWAQFSDSFWQIVNDASGSALTGDGLLNAPDSESYAQQFQLLYNYGSDLFRIRCRETGLCLASDGTSVVAETYANLPHQLWQVVAVDEDSYTITNPWSGLVLTDGDVTMNYVTHYPKKGADDGSWSRWDGLNVSWGYNWGVEPGGTLPIETSYNPMCWSEAYVEALAWYTPDWQRDSKSVVLFGYNEPDIGWEGGGSDQTVESAITNWARLEAADLPLVSPAQAYWSGWLHSFYTLANTNGFRVDHTAVHTYGGHTADSLISYCSDVYDTWHRPVWLTEFGMAYSTVSEEQNYESLAEFLWRAESLEWLARYAMFPFSGDPGTDPWSGEDHSFMYNSDGSTLTALGELYAGWDGDLSIHAETAYLLHNKAASFRLSNGGAGTETATANIRESGAPEQWVLLSVAGTDVFYIQSLLDGARLQWDGSALTCAAAGTVGAAVEWTFEEDTSDDSGYFYIDHPSTGQRLRMDRVDDTDGAPTSVSLGMGSSGTTDDESRWRFIKPSEPQAAGAVENFSIEGAFRAIALSWDETAGAIEYAVERSTEPGGSYEILASGLCSPGYTDCVAVAGVEYFYQVEVSGVEDSVAVSAPVAGALELSYTNYQAYYFSEEELADPDVSASDADANGDGVPNFVAYALGLDPREETAGLYGEPIREAFSNDCFCVEYVRAKGADNATWTWAVSDDLFEWNEVELDVNTVDLDEYLESVMVYDLLPLSETTHRFIRARILETESAGTELLFADSFATSAQFSDVNEEYADGAPVRNRCAASVSPGPRKRKRNNQWCA